MKTVDEEVIQNKKDFLTAEFTYGEMTFQTLAYCFEYIKNINKLQIKSGYFYDLGSVNNNKNNALFIYSYIFI